MKRLPRWSSSTALLAYIARFINILPLEMSLDLPLAYIRKAMIWFDQPAALRNTDARHAVSAYSDLITL